MTFSVLSTSSDILIGKDSVRDLDRITKLLHLNGGTLNDFSVLFPSVSKIAEYLQTTESDCVIILSDGQFDTNLVVNNAVCNAFELDLIKDATLQNTMQTHLPDCDQTTLKNLACIPSGASVLQNPYSYLQGWILEDRKDIFLLENSTDVINYTLSNSIIPYLRKNLRKSYECTQIKMFGIRESDAKSALANIIEAYDEIIFEFYQDNQVLDLLLRYTSDTRQIRVSDCVGLVYEKLRKFIITNDDTSIYQLALDLLTISNRTLCIYETVTAGNIASMLADCKGVAKHLIKHSEVGFSQNNIVSSQNINQALISQHGFVSVQVAYELTSILLDNTKCDIVLLTLGDLTNDNMCYTAIGDNDGIHIYKSKVNVDTNAKKILTDTAIFYLIKKLKQNDLYFNKIIV